MNFPVSELMESVERGLRTKSAVLGRPNAMLWSLQFANGARRRLEVRREDEWLQFTDDGQPLTDPTALGRFWQCLQENVTLPAGLRWTFDKRRALSLRADVPLSDEAAAESRVREVVRSFERAWKNEASAVLAPAGRSANHLELLCEEAGWPCVRRASGRLTVALDVTPAVQATVATVGNGLSVNVEIADLAGYSSCSRMAVAALALELTSRTRLVRAGADAQSGKMLFETGWTALPDAAELHAGLAALSAALRAAGESFGALQNEQLAQDYLTVCGWTADTSSTKQQPERTNT